jgi:hypothetical protein
MIYYMNCNLIVCNNGIQGLAMGDVHSKAMNVRLYSKYMD